MNQPSQVKIPHVSKTQSSDPQIQPPPSTVQVKNVDTGVDNPDRPTFDDSGVDISDPPTFDDSVSTLSNIVNLPSMPMDIKLETQKIVQEITVYRFMCRHLARQIIPHVESTIMGLRHCDIDFGLFRRGISMLVSGCTPRYSGLIWPKPTLTSTIGSTVDPDVDRQDRDPAVLVGKQDCRSYTSQLRTLIDQGKGLQTNLLEFQKKLVASGSDKNPDPLGTIAVGQVMDGTNVYNQLLHNCERDLNLIKQYCETLNLLSVNLNPRVYKEQINRCVTELLKDLKGLQDETLNPRHRYPRS